MPRFQLQLQLQRPPLVATLLTLIGIAVLCGLGTWQLQRLKWKEGLLATIEAEKYAPAQALSSLDLPPDIMLKRGTLTGHYLDKPAIKIYPRTHDGERGAHIYNAFLDTSLNRIILINRGWVPDGWSEDTLSHNQKTLTGWLSAAPKANKFTPANIPEKNEWYHVIPSEMAAYLGLSDVSPAIFMPEPTEAETLPIPLEPQTHLRNDHRQYAFFWFTMAGILIVIFGLRFCIHKNN